MTTHESLHDLVDELPEDRLADAQRELERMARRANGNDQVSLEDAPIDKEELTERELAALARLDDGEIDAIGYSREEMRKLLEDASRQ